jgi:hypothetical protein
VAITARLSRKLHQTLGDEAGEDLVTWMQQVEAQRVELRELNELNFARFDARLSASVAELRQDMQTGFGAVRQEMAQLETRLERRVGDLIKWSFVFWVGAVGAIAALAGVLR